MRAIKFRAFDNDKKEMITVFDSDKTDKAIALFMNDSQLDLMQYTGLKDSKGIEIYEGDILNVEGDIMEVVFTDAAFKPYAHKKKAYHFMIHIQKYCEVVGNIYENKELLDG